MTKYEQIKEKLRKEPKTWLITGVAGFIGSNLLEELLLLDQKVVGLDNFATGFQHNLDEVEATVSTEQWQNFEFTEGDIIFIGDCQGAMLSNPDYVLHQAAMGSVPRSIENPRVTNRVNISGFLNMLEAARDEGVKRFVYAASSSTYGDHPALPKQEDTIGNPLSPYAVTKLVNELYADVFARCYGFKSIGLRYFNIFGKRQNPDGDYAAVIPKWIEGLKNEDDLFINGDGSTSRDFCYIKNAVQANILAATAPDEAANSVYNVAYGGNTRLDDLFTMLCLLIGKEGVMPEFRDFRAGDVLHSLADISKAREVLGYDPGYSIQDGLVETVEWYMGIR